MGVLAGRYTSVDHYPKESRAALRGGFYADRVTEKGIEIGNRFAELAKQIDLTPAQLSILWTKDQPGITAPLIGPRTVKQLEDLIPVKDMKLDDEIRAACDALVPPGSVAADFHNTADWMKMQVAWVARAVQGCKNRVFTDFGNGQMKRDVRLFISATVFASRCRITAGSGVA